ncbi:MAG: hypothetical protein ACHQ1D_03060 [Nitrososphaerales archaeon]
MSQSFDNIIARCEAKSLKVKNYAPILETDEIEGVEKIKGAIIQIPEARDFKSIILLDDKEIAEVEKAKFEYFRFIKSYEAIWSEELKSIECQIQTVGTIQSPRLIKRRLDTLFGNNVSEIPESNLPKFYEFPSPNENLKIYLGQGSLEFSVLSSYRREMFFGSGRLFPRITMRIDGINVSSHEKALEYLLKIGNSILFQVDLATNVPIHLSIDKDLFKDLRIRRASKSPPTLKPPKFEYDNEAMSLYWYARTAVNMPLLQFLAFYQVLEFYFPQFSYKEAQQKIKNLLKDPTFDFNKDTDVAQILAIIKVSAKGKTFGDERTQLKATLQGCLDNESLWEFFHDSAERKEFFDVQSRNKGLVKQKVSFTNKETDIRIDTANRIYEMRCRIVHTKDEDDLELILPTSPDIRLIKFDLELIEFVARKVLIAGGRQLTL